jgi:hypothetical protein
MLVLGQVGDASLGLARVTRSKKRLTQLIEGILLLIDRKVIFFATPQPSHLQLNRQIAGFVISSDSGKGR